MSRRRAWGSALLSSVVGCLAAALCAAMGLADDRPIVLLGTIIDGTGRPPVADGALVLEGETVLAVGWREDVPIPANADVFDLRGASILPGFINAHVHNAHSGPELLETWAQAGVTTLRDLGALRGVSWWLRSSNPRLATVLASGPIVTVPGGYPIAGNGFPSLAVSSAEDARRTVRELARQRADVIKISLESHAGPVLTPEETAAVVETAHALGLPVSVHATSVPDLRQAIEAGVDDVAHMVQGVVPDEVLKAMVEKGIAWVPTLAAVEFSGAPLRRFLALGGVVGLGNDSGYLGFDLGMPMDEIRALARAGMTSMEILIAGTRDGARILRREALLGTLEPGKQADVLVVRGDPLADFEALGAPLIVIHRGVVIRREPGI